MDHSPAPSLPDWIERQLPPGLTRYRVDVGGLAMHMMESGRGATVLLLHGNPTWGFLYRKVMAELAGDPLRLVVPDLIGLGFSDKPPAAAHTLDNHARWLGALLDGLGLRDLVFVAQDWGGAIGLRALADRPGLARGLVLLNTIVGPPRPGFRPTGFHRFARLPLVSDLAFRLLGAPQVALHLVQGDRSSIRGEVARAYRDPLRGLAHNVAPLALARMVPNDFDHPSIEPLRTCQAYVEGFGGPAAIVWGDRDPVLGRVVTWIQKLMPQARVTRTPAGHFLQEEVPGEIAAAIRFVAAAAAAELRTDRLRLVQVTAEQLRAELAGNAALAAALGVEVPEGWPPDLYDDEPRRFGLRKLEEAPRDAAWWRPWYLVLEDAGPVLVGMVGFKGPPADGSVELGYSVVRSFQRRGLAAEAVDRLVAWAFDQPGVRRVTAHTLPHLAPSIRVLEKTGFRHVGPGTEAGAILFEKRRELA